MFVLMFFYTTEVTFVAQRAKMEADLGCREWGDAYKTNVTAVYFTTTAFLPLLQKGKGEHGHLAASVIVISSSERLV